MVLRVCGMTLFETLALKIGGSVSGAVVRRWVADSALASDAGTSLAELLTKAGLDYRERERARRQFEEISEQIAERLEPYFSTEFAGGLPPHEGTAAALAVADTIDVGARDTRQLLALDLNPELLVRHFREQAPRADIDLSDAARGLYDLALYESCVYLVEMVGSLPEFTTKATSELLSRDRAILDRLERVLQRLPEADGYSEGIDFELRYRRAVIHALEEVRLFGLPSVRREVTRYALSVAYITLAAAASESRTGSKQRDLAPVPLERLVADSPKLLIRGEAGSGKTTLVHWLAVNAAGRGFTGDLDSLNDSVPFVVRLRRYADRELPSPAEFINEVAKPIEGLQPDNWAEAVLDGYYAFQSALVLVDGLDELPPPRRVEVEDWLAELVDAFPSARWVVTSRPAALDHGFRAPEGFTQVELLTMNLGDIERFVRHWHRAVAQAQTEAVEKEALEKRGAVLAELVREEPALRRLASNPLLCAVICALHADEQDALPRDRVGLYRTALDALLFRRDAERGVKNQIPLTRDQTQLLLEDLAWWMVSNGFTEVSRAMVERRLEVSLARMVGVPTAQQVLAHFVERTGLLTEPVMGRLEFIHKTFLEFLAASHGVAGQEFGALLAHVERDDWEEVVKMAIGVADPVARDTLIRELIAKGKASNNAAPRHFLLAAAGASLAPELDPGLRRDLTDLVAALVPPRTQQQARALASAGEMAVSALKNPGGLSVDAARSSIRALRLIGGDAALQQIVGYAQDSRVKVVRELILGLHDFDPAEYGPLVLARSPLDDGSLGLSGAENLGYLGALANLRDLEVDAEAGLFDYEGLSGARSLTRLALRNVPDLQSVEQLADVPLEELSLIDVESLASLDGIGRYPLRTLKIENAPLLENLHPVSQAAAGISHFALVATAATDLEPLAYLGALQRVYLARQAVESFQFVESLPELCDLELAEIDGSLDLSWLALAPKLRRVTLASCDGEITLASFDYRELEHLGFYRCHDLSSSSFSGIRGIKNLDVGLTLERQLDLSGAETDQTRVRSCPRLRELVVPDAEELEISKCTELRAVDFKPAAASLRRLIVFDCPDLVELNSLQTCRMLERVEIESDDSQVLASLEHLRATVLVRPRPNGDPAVN